MGADFKQLKEFTEKIEKLNDTQKDEFMESCCKELAARLLAKVVKRTPVGKAPKVKQATVKAVGASGKSKAMLTAEGARYQQYWSTYKGGTLRKGWTGGTNTSATEYAKSISIKHSGNAYQLEISNPVEYASYVEYGHRQTPGRYVPALGVRLKQGWTPGKFMLTISEEEIQNSKDAILKNKLNKYMKEVFK